MANNRRMLTIGTNAARTRVFAAADLAAYRALFLGAAAEDADVIPPPLLGGLISDLLGTELPGPGTNWLKQQASFPAAARPGEPITAVVTVVRLRPEKQLVNLQTICTAAGGRVVWTGEALVMVRDLVVNE